MDQVFNIYCDESCHLENDRKDIMVLGAIWCPFEAAKGTFVDLRRIKSSHGLSKDFEIKWTKSSPGKLDLYQDVLKYFFTNENLHFRALIAKGKNKLKHEKFQQDHDTWYYKMYFHMLRIILNPKACYKIYLDIKDTGNNQKIKKLHDVLCSNVYDFSHTIIQKVQPVRSHEIEIIQIVDLLIGAISYLHRGLSTSEAKLELLEYIKKTSGYSLKFSTLVREEKFNLFVWTPEVHEEQ